MRQHGFAALVFFVLGACAQTSESMQKVVAVEVEAHGLTADEIERRVASPFERALAAIHGLQHIRSSSTSGGFCRIELEFGTTPNQKTLQLVESTVLAAWKQSSVRMAAPVIAIQDRRIP